MLAVLRGSAIALLSPLAHHTRARCSTSRTASRSLSIDLSPFLATGRRTAGVLGAPESSRFVASSSGSSARFYAAMAFDKIKVENPIVEMDGEPPVAVFLEYCVFFLIKILSSSWKIELRISGLLCFYGILLAHPQRRSG